MVEGPVPTFEPPAGQYRPVPDDAVQRGNGFAVASMVCGIFWPFCLTAVLAIVFGHLALGQIRASRGAQRGRGQAVAGLVLGYLGLGAVIAGFLINSSGS